MQLSNDNNKELLQLKCEKSTQRNEKETVSDKFSIT